MCAALWPSDIKWNHKFGPTLTHVINYLNQCSHLIIACVRHSSESNFTAHAQTIILYNKFEEYIYKIIATSKDWNIKDASPVQKNSYYVSFAPMMSAALAFEKVKLLTIEFSVFRNHFSLALIGTWLISHQKWSERSFVYIHWFSQIKNVATRPFTWSWTELVFKFHKLCSTPGLFCWL